MPRANSPVPRLSTPRDRIEMSRRRHRDVRAIRVAIASLDGVLVDVEPLSLGRTGIYRAVVTLARRQENVPAGTSIQAVYVTRDQEDCLTPPAEMHRLLFRLHDLGAPVARPLHRDVVTTAHGQVGIWEWMRHSALAASEWGALTATLHRTGRHLEHPRIYDPGHVFEIRLRRIRELISTRGHPLFGAGALLRTFEDALDRAVAEARQAADSSALTLVHGDNQPANVMRGRRGLALNDFERIVTGPPALDLAGLLLGIQHYGYPAGTGEDFLAGYGPDAPSLDQARPYTRIRELSGAAVAMIQAGDSPAMEHQMRIRRVAVTRPGEGEPWTYVSPGPAGHLTFATEALNSCGPAHRHKGSSDDPLCERCDQDQS